MYNKIFTKILDSSIWLEADSTRLVWLTMIASMDSEGFCQFASAANVARRAIVSDEAAINAIKVLESPDANSSDPDNEGRRIERVPGGWIVLNASKYRETVTRAIAQEKNRLRVAKHRAKKTPCNASVMVANDSVTQSEAYAEAKAAAVSIPPKPPKGEGDAEKIYNLYPRKEAKKAALKAIQGAIGKGGSERVSFLVAKTTAYAEAVSRWPKDALCFVPLPASWFNGCRFDDDPQYWERKPIHGINGHKEPLMR